MMRNPLDEGVEIPRIVCKDDPHGARQADAKRGADVTMEKAKLLKEVRAKAWKTRRDKYGASGHRKGAYARPSYTETAMAKATATRWLKAWDAMRAAVADTMAPDLALAAIDAHDPRRGGA